MHKRFADPPFKTVEHILKRYLDPKALERSVAADWPAVREQDDGSVVVAIRKVLRSAVEQLVTSKDDPKAAEEMTVVRARYIDGQRIEDLSHSRYSADVSTLHRWRKDAIAELQVILGELNRAAQRRQRAQRFTGHGPIIGAQELADDIAVTIRDTRAAPVVVLEGMGGLGKTTHARLVALHIAQEDGFADVLWTSAQQAEFDVYTGQQRRKRAAATRADDLVEQLAHELGVSRTDNAADLRTNVVALCKRARYLIVFDNLESVEDLAALAPLIEEIAVPSRILITTRHHTPEALPPSIVRRYITLHELDEPRSVGLLRAAAAHVGENTMSRATDADLAQIYAVTGGNPLALWLVAGQSRHVPWHLFLQDFLSHQPRNRSTEEIYDYLYWRSWELLSDAAREVLVAMHRFERGTDYESLRALTDLDVAPFQGAIEELRHRMLLLFDGATRVYVHRLTYTFVRRGILAWERQ